MNGFDMFIFGVVFVLIVITISVIHSIITDHNKEKRTKYNYFNDFSSRCELKEQNLKLVNSLA